ncbi:Glycerol-3-phosphate acyltransferase [bioreactor metagenome]|uniref:Glycerol-3-phosphate acyltransferase n=1 Tax=bioreactor metagenome TaxID=1076179 RepID=A0A645HIC8_9ZZZZ
MGSTNIMRTLGTKWGIIVQVIDILKGFVPVMLFANLIGSNWGMCGEDSFLNLPILGIIVGMSAIAGHVWSCFVKFKGGKGVNTAAGMLIAILPIEFGVGIFVFVLTVGISGYVSLASMLASSTIPLVLFLRYNLFRVDIKGYFTLIYFTLGFLLLVLFTHRSNIARLISGTENKFEKWRFLKCACSKKKAYKIE